ncbi:hypothetical protein D5S17_24130 [Pseudonocardiaceae bacterium YIM PH 21723]|nr:hypothetical protein D5S17_24130 [Pseudonocardiaceae bacterium YIM PH 21723]
MSIAMLASAARAFWGSGMITQTRPWHLPGMAKARWSTGSSAALPLALAASRQGDKVGLVDDRGEISYRQLDDAASRLAAGISAATELGTEPKIAVMCRNHRYFLIAMGAAGRLGANLIFLNTEFSGPQLTNMFKNITPDYIIADEEFLPRLGDAPCPVVAAWTDSALPGQTTVDQVVARNKPTSVLKPASTGKVTILTSGTTGTPKGASRSTGPKAVLAIFSTLMIRCGVKAGDTTLIAPPAFHGVGLMGLHLSLVLGNPIIMRRKFKPEQVLKDIDQYKVRCIVGVPVMYQRMVELPAETRDRYDHSTLEMVLSSGSALRPELFRRFTEAFGPVLYNAYGSSECGFAAIATPTDMLEAPGTVGQPSIGIPVQVLRDGAPVSAEESGTIYVGGPQVISQYMGGGAKQVINGLVNTGDVGHFDTSGRLYVDGREDDMIVSGGENVYPQEVEDLLSKHPSITEAAVVGVEDEQYGQRLVAYVVPRGSQPDTDELLAYVKDNLARYKVPRQVVYLEELPRNATGKVLRRVLGK